MSSCYLDICEATDHHMSFQVTLVAVVRVKSPPARAALWIETGRRRHSAHLPIRNCVHSPVETKQIHTVRGFWLVAMLSLPSCVAEPVESFPCSVRLQECDFGVILKPPTTDFQECLRDEIGRVGREGEREGARGRR